MLSRRKKSKLKKNKKASSGQKNQNRPKQEGLTKLENMALKLSTEALEKAADTLRQNFKTIPKTLFQRGLPSPYIRSKESRPLHFSSDAKYMMYFTKTEFIKVDLSTAGIVLRKKIESIEFSPISCTYDIWSHDSSLVLAFVHRSVYSFSTGYGIKVFDTTTGAYTDVFELLKSKFEIKSDSGNHCTIECFHPSNKNQLIVRLSKSSKEVRTGYFNGTSEELYCFDYKTGQNRLLMKNLSQQSKSHVLSQKDHLIVLNQEPLGRSSDEISQKSHNHSISIFSGKGFRKLVTIKNVSLNNAPRATRSMFGDSHYEDRRPLLVSYSGVLDGKICIRFEDYNLFVLDMHQRRVRSHVVDLNEVNKVKAILPASSSFSEVFEDEGEVVEGFRLVKSDEKNTLCSRLFDNQFKVFNKENIIIVLRPDIKGCEDKLALQIEIFSLNDSFEQISDNHVEKEIKTEVLEQNPRKSMKLIQKIKFFVSDLFKSLTTQVKTQNFSVPCGENYHIQKLILSPTPHDKKLLASSPSLYILSHKVINMNSWTLTRAEIRGQNLLPGKGYRYRALGDFRIRNLGDRLLNPHNLNYAICYCVIKSKTNRTCIFSSFINDFKNNEFFAWKAKMETPTNPHLKREDTLFSYHQFVRIDRNSQNLMLMTQKNNLGYKPNEEFEPFIFKIVNLKRKEVTQGTAWLNKRLIEKEADFVDFFAKRTITEGLEDQRSPKSQKKISKKEKIYEKAFKGQLVLNNSRLQTFDGYEANLEGFDIIAAPLDNRAKVSSGKRLENKRIHINNPENSTFAGIQIISIGEDLYLFSLNKENFTVTIQRFESKNFESAKNKWIISLSTGEKEFIDQVSKFNSMFLDFFGRKHLAIAWGELKEDQKAGQFVDGFLLFSPEAFYNNLSRNGRKMSLLVNFQLPLNSQKSQATDEDMISSTPCKCNVEYLETPYLRNSMIIRALKSKEYPVVELMENLFFNIKEHTIHERDFGAELEELWKELESVGAENVVDLLLRLVSLGFEFYDLIQKLGLEEILVGLGEEGWVDGINYFKLTLITF